MKTGDAIFLDNLSMLLDLLQRKGVKRYAGPVLSARPDEGVCETRVELELSPAPDMTPAEKTTVDPDACRCGHPETAHTNGLCLFGCEVDRCAPPEAKE